jgi:hypothetical protein
MVGEEGRGETDIRFDDRRETEKVANDKREDPQRDKVGKWNAR